MKTKSVFTICFVIRHSAFTLPAKVAAAAWGGTTAQGP